jgi:uncharacterized protein YhjY with autotransporter beta-barrel domain
MSVVSKRSWLNTSAAAAWPPAGRRAHAKIGTQATSLLVVGVSLLGCSVPARAEPAARSLDQALVETLALGRAAGCGSALGVPEFALQSELDTYLRDIRNAGEIGKELAAICGSSAVSSSSALGGSLGSLQTTKTVSQFRLARSRADSRLNARGKRTGLGGGPVLLVQLGAGLPTMTGDASPAEAETGPGVFVHATGERRDRVTTALEAGYRANMAEMLIGMDYTTRERWVAGAWVGYNSVDANYRNPNVLIGGTAGGFGASVATLQSAICKVGPGGGFDDKGARLGGFIAKRFGDGFADVAVQYSRRNYAYQRNVCAIEAGPEEIVADPDSVSGFSSRATIADGGTKIDDIYAGTISGKAKVTEWGLSARVGFDVLAEQLQWGPRVSLTYLRTRVGAYTEAGRTSVTNRVESNTPLVLFTDRAAGDPTGLELSFDRQRRTSLQSEVQLVAAYRFDTDVGTLVPRLSASWLHEFKGERELVGLRMAQDFRADPTRFSFTTDSVDKNKGAVAIGLSMVQGPQFTADVEVSRLLADDRFDSTKVALQAIWRF